MDRDAGTECCSVVVLAFISYNVRRIATASATAQCDGPMVWGMGRTSTRALELGNVKEDKLNGQCLTQIDENEAVR